MPVHCFNYTGHREQSFSVFQDAEDHKMQNALYLKKEKKKDVQETNSLNNSEGH